VSTPIEQLTPIDFKILEYIGRFDSISRDDIVRHFSNVDSIDYRIAQLAARDYEFIGGGNRAVSVRVPVPNSSYLIEEYESAKGEYGLIQHKATNRFRLSALGKKALEDNRAFRRQANLKSWKERFWIPFLVSIATTILMYVLLNMLVPRLLSITAQ
jgi:hypothetical protein